jgi:hypothetical protein
MTMISMMMMMMMMMMMTGENSRGKKMDKQKRKTTRDQTTVKAGIIKGEFLNPKTGRLEEDEKRFCWRKERGDLMKLFGRAGGATSIVKTHIAKGRMDRAFEFIPDGAGGDAGGEDLEMDEEDSEHDDEGQWEDEDEEC